MIGRCLRVTIRFMDQPAHGTSTSGNSASCLMLIRQAVEGVSRRGDAPAPVQLDGRDSEDAIATSPATRVALPEPSKRSSSR
jgi:hypothetical protein